MTTANKENGRIPSAEFTPANSAREGLETVLYFAGGSSGQLSNGSFRGFVETGVTHIDGQPCTIQSLLGMESNFCVIEVIANHARQTVEAALYRTISGSLSPDAAAAIQAKYRGYSLSSYQAEGHQESPGNPSSATLDEKREDNRPLEFGRQR